MPKIKSHNKMDTIYEKLGDKRLKQLLDSFYEKVFASDVIGHLFANSDQELVKDKQFCFLTQFLGGPPRFNEKYGAPRMRMRHLPHAIDEAAKNEWLSLMKASIYELSWEDHNKEALYNCFPKLAEHMKNC